MMSPDFDPMAFGAEMLETLPGLAEKLEADNPGMHVTDSVDYDVVLDGEIVLELDDGQTVERVCSSQESEAPDKRCKCEHHEKQRAVVLPASATCQAERLRVGTRAVDRPACQTGRSEQG